MAATGQVIVATTLMLLVSSARANGPQQCTPNNVLQVSVTKPATTIQLQCPSSYTIAPECSPSVGEVYTDENCSIKKNLSDLCPGATGSQTSSGNKPVSLTFPQLPPTTTTFYYKCTESGNWCKFAVTVSAAPPEGPQVCAVKNTSVALAVRGEGGSTQFSCGSSMQLNPSDVKKSYDENCTKEKELKDLTRSGGGSSNYVLKADKKPKDHVLCYVCGNAGAKGKDGNCVVLISVSAGSNLAAVSVFGLALPSVLALLHFT